MVVRKSGEKYPAVIIGGISYEIRMVDELMVDEQALGYIEFEKQLISIDPAIPDQRKAQTIIHEITHGIFYEAGMREHEEELVDRLSIVLTRLIVETDPKLFDKIRKLAN